MVIGFPTSAFQSGSLLIPFGDECAGYRTQVVHKRVMLFGVLQGFFMGSLLASPQYKNGSKRGAHLTRTLMSIFIVVSNTKRIAKARLL